MPAETAVRRSNQQLEETPQRNDGLLSGYFDDDEAEIDGYQQRLLDIKNVVECLTRLAVTIRNPAPLEQFTDEMPGIVAFFDFKHLEHVQQKFPRLNYKCTQRLAKALTYRRVFLRYRKYHHERHETHQEIIGNEKENDLADGKGGITAEESRRPEENDRENDSQPPDWRDDISDVTTTSYAPSCADGSGFSVPEVPRGSTDGHFLCPSCYLHITVQNRHQWK